MHAVNRYCFIAALSCLPFTATHAGKDHQHEHKHHQHGAHSHGQAQLNIAIDGQQLLIEFTSPAANIVGFEHQPHNDAQRQSITSAIQQLALGDQLFITRDGQCQLHQHEISTDLQNKHTHDHKHAHDKKDSKQDSHADFSANYQFNCKDVAAIHSLEVKLFEDFPAIEGIEVQFITAARQGAASLDKNHPTIKF